MMIYFNLFKTPKGTMIAMCDQELMGKVLKEGKIEIDLVKYGAFYKEELISEEEAKKRIDPSVYSANVVGNRSVGILIEKGIIKKGDVKTIQGVMYVHLFKVDR